MSFLNRYSPSSRRQQAAAHELVELEAHRPAEQRATAPPPRRDGRAPRRGRACPSRSPAGRRCASRIRSSIVDGTWIGASRLTQRSRPGYSPSSASATRMPRSISVSSSSWMKNALPPARAAICSTSSSMSWPGTNRSASISRRAASGSSSRCDDLGAELLRELQDARLGPRRHQAEDRARRVDLEQRGEQLLAVLIGPVDVLADEDHRLVAFEPLLDARAGSSSASARRVSASTSAPGASARAPSSMPKICSAVRASREPRRRSVARARDRSAAARAAGGARPRAARHPRRGRARRARDRRSRRTASSRCRRARSCARRPPRPARCPRGTCARACACRRRRRRRSRSGACAA